jgi:hypothetical protein
MIFPPIHNTHHNNKALFISKWFESLVGIVILVKILTAQRSLRLLASAREFLSSPHFHKRFAAAVLCSLPKSE